MICTLIIITSVLLIVSKFFDCFTTTIGFKKHGNGEKNPVALFIMRKIGIGATIWTIFTFTVALAVLFAYSTIKEDNTLYSSAFIILGIIISLIQFDVARHNYAGNKSFITRIIENIYGRYS